MQGKEFLYFFFFPPFLSFAVQLILETQGKEENKGFLSLGWAPVSPDVGWLPVELLLELAFQPHLQYWGRLHRGEVESPSLGILKEMGGGAINGYSLGTVPSTSGWWLGSILKVFSSPGDSVILWLCSHFKLQTNVCCSSNSAFEMFWNHVHAETQDS